MVSTVHQVPWTGVCWGEGSDLEGGFRERGPDSEPPLPPEFPALSPSCTLALAWCGAPRPLCWAVGASGHPVSCHPGNPHLGSCKRQTRVLPSRT